MLAPQAGYSGWLVLVLVLGGSFDQDFTIAFTNERYSRDVMTDADI